MQNDEREITRPLGATPPQIQRAIDGANADLKEGRGEGIALPRDTAAPTIPGKERKRRASAVRRRPAETLHADARLRIYKTGNGNEVRVVLSGARSGVSVEQKCHGGMVSVLFTLARLWLRGAALLTPDRQLGDIEAAERAAPRSPQLRLDSAQRDGRATPGA